MRTMPRSGEEVGIAIVGAGDAGRQHVQAISTAELCSLVGYIDPSDAAVLAGEHRYTELDEILADERVDIVAFCSPPGSRPGDIRRTLSAGKGILLEKPPAASLEEFDAITAQVSAAGVPAGVMLQHRFLLPRASLIPPMGKGGVGLVEVSRPRPADRYRDTSWRADPGLAFGGITAHLGVHYLDLACSALGEVRDVYVDTLETVGRGIDIRVQGRATFDTGAELSFLVTATSMHRSERIAFFAPHWAMTVTDGKVEIDGFECPLPAGGPARKLRTSVYEDMQKAVRTGDQPEVAALHKARSVMVILDAIRNAADNG